MKIILFINICIMLCIKPHLGSMRLQQKFERTLKKNLLITIFFTYYNKKFGFEK